MNEITQLLESIKAGELGVATQRLSLLQNEVNNALALIQDLTNKVEGDGGYDYPGVIHSPARSQETFVGTYYVGDTEANLNSKRAFFIFGVQSYCKFYFQPVDPLHAVNKKFVDQCVSPIASQLLNMICRFGDRVPLNPHNGTYLTKSGKYVFTADPLNSFHRVQWLFDDNNPNIENTIFAAHTLDPVTGKDLNLGSKFWLNVNDARYYGETTISEYNIATIGAMNKDCLSRHGKLGNRDTDGIKIDCSDIMDTPAEVKNAAMLFSGANLKFDALSHLRWLDDTEVHKKADTAVAIIQNLRDITNDSVVIFDQTHYYIDDPALLPKNVDWFGYVVLGKMVLYWCKTFHKPRADWHSGELPNKDGGDWCNPEYEIGLPSGLFQQILHISPTFVNYEVSSGSNDDDVMLQVMWFDGSQTDKFNIKYQLCRSLDSIADAGCDALVYIVGIKA